MRILRKLIFIILAIFTLVGAGIELLVSSNPNYNQVVGSVAFICLLVLLDGLIDRKSKPAKYSFDFRPNSKSGLIIQTVIGIAVYFYSLTGGLSFDATDTVPKLTIAPLGMILGTWIIYVSTDATKLMNKTRGSQRKKIVKQKIQQLEARPSWRFAKAMYFGIALLLVVVGIFAALADTYHEHQTGYIAWLGILQIVLYPLYWRVAHYVSFGKSKQPNEESISFDAVARKDKDGKLITTMPATLLGSTLFADKELKIHPVTKLAYDFDNETYTKVMDKLKVNTQHRIKLEKLIELNSGYLTTDLIKDEFGINNEVSAKLLAELVSHKQAAKAPSSRKLYRLSAQ